MYGIAISRYNLSQMTSQLNDMKLHQRILLAATLILFLFGLAVHSQPASPCGCTFVAQDETSASNLDLCLVCQLQIGIYTTSCPVCPIHDGAFHISNLLALYPLERAISILHPPIAS
jgi:hypothetical protein